MISSTVPSGQRNQLTLQTGGRFHVNRQAEYRRPGFTGRTAVVEAVVTVTIGDFLHQHGVEGLISADTTGQIPGINANLRGVQRKEFSDRHLAVRSGDFLAEIRLPRCLPGPLRGVRPGGSRVIAKQVSLVALIRVGGVRAADKQRCPPLHPDHVIDEIPDSPLIARRDQCPLVFTDGADSLVESVERAAEHLLDNVHLGNFLSRDRVPRYPSDLTDEQWPVLEPRARQVMKDLTAILDQGTTMTGQRARLTSQVGTDQPK